MDSLLIPVLDDLSKADKATPRRVRRLGFAVGAANRIYDNAVTRFRFPRGVNGHGKPVTGSGYDETSWYPPAVLQTRPSAVSAASA